ncbi:hypothetical protein [Leptospira santarosai]|uniref:Uncharacterized protein n=1 Tax=Leptospira santarosai serovar Arenal str. MAVJ 401 TaxID=1049976 RepID=M6JMH2_9LEPT|nr:hypothetical protein [Leptospira santarosai]EMM76810.1 hypothetical protein LEP1GSC040_0862 [Leptospira santarosai str. 2000030832]EMN22911.1 hypothetical protein LEP1GSC063_0638 [Leptospira santarosai serovar Arenal str. MAVJ 401]MDI7208167.1 hypothetical protein [Leptospira santarosai]MDI7210434.1 hypothetical protein [Leptospira santarosai]MDI7235031.1 hypothetical protein [Leptospira santarosai]
MKDRFQNFDRNLPFPEVDLGIDQIRSVDFEELYSVLLMQCDQVGNFVVRGLQAISKISQHDRNRHFKQR